MLLPMKPQPPVIRILPPLRPLTPGGRPADAWWFISCPRSPASPMWRPPCSRTSDARSAPTLPHPIFPCLLSSRSPPEGLSPFLFVFTPVDLLEIGLLDTGFRQLFQRLQQPTAAEPPVKEQPEQG